MNNRIIVIATIFFLLISFIFLSFVEQKKQDPNSHEWWAIYFENPKNDSLDFTIENHSKAENFHWEIFSDKTKEKEGDDAVSKGEVKTISVSAIEAANKKITIIVTDKNNNKKEIYKVIASD